MRLSLAFAVLLTVPVFALAAEPEYDLLIRNGRIVDGTGNPWFHGDVAIRGDRIVAVGRVPAGTAKRDDRREGAGRRARLHRHALALRRPAARRRPRPEQDPPGRDDRGARRGPLGRPAQGASSRRGRSRPAARSSPGPRSAATSTPWTRPASPVNVATYVGLDNVWECVMGKSLARPTPKQFERDEGHCSTRR